MARNRQTVVVFRNVEDSTTLLETYGKPGMDNTWYWKAALLVTEAIRHRSSYAPVN